MVFEVTALFCRRSPPTRRPSTKHCCPVQFALLWCSVDAPRLCGRYTAPTCNHYPARTLSPAPGGPRSVQIHAGCGYSGGPCERPAARFESTLASALAAGRSSLGVAGRCTTVRSVGWLELGAAAARRVLRADG